MPHRPLHLLLVDDHAYVADSFEAYLTTVDPTIRVSKTTSVPQAIAIVQAAEDIGLALIDLHMPDIDGLAALHLLRDVRPDLPVAIISGDVSTAAVRAALDANANGFITKTMDGATVIAAIRLVHAGQSFFPVEALRDAPAGYIGTPTLTAREDEVLAALVEGQSNKEIAAALKVTPGAVALHLTHVYRKLNVTSRGQAVRRAFELRMHADRRVR